MIASGALRAQYAEGFDSQATADVTITAEPDTNYMFVDYGNMTIGSTTFSVPEAPRKIPGSAPTRGILMQVNLTAVAPKSVNVFAGVVPYTFAGRYRLSFDAWINVPVPFPGGSTEQLLYGVGTDGNVILGRHTIASNPLGVWGWLAGENGYSSEDAVICEGGFRLENFGDQQIGYEHFFDDAFDQASGSALHNTPCNQWVRVDIDVDGANIRTYYNGIEFHNQTVITLPIGYAMLGYEDPFSSLGTLPDAQWGLFDNFRVTLPTGCGVPGVAATQGTATGGQIMNGGALPAVGCPLSIRLRGAEANAATLLATGFPSPITLPVPINGCTLGLEVTPVLATLFNFADALGNAQLTLELPATSALCGVNFGFQYFYADSTSPCGISHTEGLDLTIGS
ncbi:MAG: hypothetical protein KDC98_23725 [Planctomycetes bacterium]|nr:hypothetical protein [Planctomycetota bacterium]